MIILPGLEPLPVCQTASERSEGLESTATGHSGMNQLCGLSLEWLQVSKTCFKLHGEIKTKHLKVLINVDFFKSHVFLPKQQETNGNGVESPCSLG